MRSVNTNENKNDPMNWSWTTTRTTTTPRPRTRPILRTRPMMPKNCAARAKYYRNKGLVVPPLFEKCAPQPPSATKVKQMRVTNRINRAENAFSILGIPKNSNRSVIRKAYLRLSKMYHPNKRTGNANTFVKIKNAYNSLM